MDALTFGSSVLLRHLTFSEARFVSHKEFLCYFCYVVITAKRFTVAYIDLETFQCYFNACDY